MCIQLPSARADELSFFGTAIADINFYIVKFFSKRFGVPPLPHIAFSFLLSHAPLPQHLDASPSFGVPRGHKVVKAIAELLMQPAVGKHGIEIPCQGDCF